MIAVILAAGLSTRFGESKMSYQVEGKPLIVHVCDALKELCEVNVVLGGNRELIEPILPNYIDQIIYNSQYALGMFTSVKASVEYAIEREQNLLLTLGDLLYVNREDYQKLILNYKDKSVFSCFEESIGPPCIISTRDLQNLKNKDLDRGLKNYIHDKVLCELKNAGRDIDVKKDIGQKPPLIK